MTVAGGFIGASRRPDLLGIHSIDRFTLSVPDLTEAAKFHEHFGLNVVDRDNGYGIQTFGFDHDWGRMVEGPRKRLHHVSYGVYEDDLPRFKKHIESQGVKILDAPKGFEANSLWVEDPDGTLIELKVADKTSPDEKDHGRLMSAPAGVAAQPGRSQAGDVQPKRLAHLLCFASDVPKQIDFYTRILGMGLSDRSGDGIAFLHGRHGSDHHMIAFGRSKGPGLHHTSWDVPTVHEVGLGAMKMAERGFDRGWGLGRHVLGSNYFHYVRDPWGSYAEYSCDMDYIPADVDWEAGDHPNHDSGYVWGPKSPSDFGHNFEADPS